MISESYKIQQQLIHLKQVGISKQGASLMTTRDQEEYRPKVVSRNPLSPTSSQHSGAGIVQSFHGSFNEAGSRIESRNSTRLSNKSPHRRVSS